MNIVLKLFAVLLFGLLVVACGGNGDDGGNGGNGESETEETATQPLSRA